MRRAGTRETEHGERGAMDIPQWVGVAGASLSILAILGPLAYATTFNLHQVPGIKASGEANEKAILKEREERIAGDVATQREIAEVEKKRAADYSEIKTSLLYLRAMQGDLAARRRLDEMGR